MLILSPPLEMKSDVCHKYDTQWLAITILLEYYYRRGLQNDN